MNEADTLIRFNMQWNFLFCPRIIVYFENSDTGKCVNMHNNMWNPALQAVAGWSLDWDPKWTKSF